MWALTLLQYFPFVLQAVMAVEQTVASETGATKKKLVLDSITSAAGVGETAPGTNVELISKLIDSTVATLNAVGIFSHAAAAPVAKAA